jgi:hypothetical protein
VDVEARTALPYVPLAAVLSVAALVASARLLPVPGVASAVCGLYLLAASVLSLFSERLAPPPLLLPAAMALDLACWLRASDLRALADIWPSRNPQTALRRAWRPRDRRPRALTPRRALIGGAVYGLLVGLLEPPYAVLLGSPRDQWSSESVAIATALSVVGGAVAAVLAQHLTRPGDEPG